MFFKALKQYEVDRGTGHIVCRFRNVVTQQEFVCTFPPDRLIESSLHAWKAGTLIHLAMPRLTASERELFLTGIEPSAWDRAFAEDDRFCDDEE